MTNAKLEVTNDLIKDINRQASGFRNINNLKTKLLISVSTKKTINLILSCT
ncbi:transposase [Streptococcus thoraltensis]|uniref:transposase n=1 Tax=Streptococcus thoraltensis TaxID=55085 RepID=UPI0038B412C1